MTMSFFLFQHWQKTADNMSNQFSFLYAPSPLSCIKIRPKSIPDLIYISSCLSLSRTHSRSYGMTKWYVRLCRQQQNLVWSSMEMESFSGSFAVRVHWHELNLIWNERTKQKKMCTQPTLLRFFAPSFVCWLNSTVVCLSHICVHEIHIYTWVHGCNVSLALTHTHTHTYEFALAHTQTRTPSLVYVI